MSDKPYPILWSFRRCPYAMRARLAIQSSQQQVELREILLRDKPDAFKEASAKATVPVLQLPDGTVLDESRDIMMWALGRADPEGWLGNVSDQDCNLFFERLDGPFKHHLDRYKYASRFDAEEALQHRANGAAFITELDAQLSVQPSLCGDELGVLDYASLPFIRQFRIADSEWFDAQNWPYLHKWLQSFLASTDFQSVMKKYLPWSEDAGGQIFPTSISKVD